MLPSAQCETLSGCVGAREVGGGATSTELPIELKTPRPLVPVPPSTPRSLTSGDDATGCSCKFAMVGGIPGGCCIRPSLMFDESIGRGLGAGGAGGGGGVRIGPSIQCSFGGPCIVSNGFVSSKLSPKA